MDEFMLRAVLAGVGVALIAGPLGCFVVWRRMAYFGATLSHAALLGIALGFLFDVNVYIGILFISLATSVLLLLMRGQRRLTDDTLLGILAHATLALGLVVFAFMDSVQVNLFGYLFGDILAVGWREVIWIYAGGLGSLLALTLIWRPLLRITVHEELARVEGTPVWGMDLAFMVLLSVVIAVAMQIVGLLLIVSLLILPPAVARRFARTPEQMAVLAALIGVGSVITGLMASLRWDTPAGPSVVVAAAVGFALVMLVPARA